MKLFSYFRSSAAWRVRIALNYKNVEHGTIPVHLLREGGQQNSESFRNANPQGLVPALEVDGQVIGQSMAILEYLEETHPEPALLPMEAWARAEVRSMALAIACDIHPLNNLRVLNYLKGPLEQGPAAVSTWYKHWVAAGFAGLEVLALRHGDGKHMFGDSVTLADVCLVPQMYNARRFECDVKHYPTLVAINAHLSRQAAFAFAHPDTQPDIE